MSSMDVSEASATKAAEISRIRPDLFMRKIHEAALHDSRFGPSDTPYSYLRSPNPSVTHADASTSSFHRNHSGITTTINDVDDLGHSHRRVMVPSSVKSRSRPTSPLPQRSPSITSNVSSSSRGSQSRSGGNHMSSYQDYSIHRDFKSLRKALRKQYEEKQVTLRPTSAGGIEYSYPDHPTYFPLKPSHETSFRKPSLEESLRELRELLPKKQDNNNVQRVSSHKSNASVDSSRLSVRFAPDTLSVDRENKPKKKLKLKNNRKPKFAHPVTGHFLPPSTEIIAFVTTDQELALAENQYTRFESIWCDPSTRQSEESKTKRNARMKRLVNILSDLARSHDAFNRVKDSQKGRLMLEEIVPRYISCLDIALMDCELKHAEELLETIITSLKILQVNLHQNFFERNGHPRKLPHVPKAEDDFFGKLGPVLVSMNRITGDQFKYVSHEAQFVRLQLELLTLVICPWECVIFRSQLAIIPTTASSALEMLRSTRVKDPYCVKWVNDSVMHRDYMRFLKQFGFADTIGAINPIPMTIRLLQQRPNGYAEKAAAGVRKRPATAKATMQSTNKLIVPYTTKRE